MADISYNQKIIRNYLEQNTPFDSLAKISNSIKNREKVDDELSRKESIAEKLEIKGDVNTYSARHSFSTVLQRSGVSTEFISEALGHSNVKTTANYLAGFEDDKKAATVKALTDFTRG